MTIQQMLDEAKAKGRCEYDRYLVVYDQTRSVYKDGRLVVQLTGWDVTAFQAWTRNDAALINAVFDHLGISKNYHCTWSGNGVHLIQYDTEGEVLHADTPETLIRRLYT